MGVVTDYLPITRAGHMVKSSRAPLVGVLDGYFKEIAETYEPAGAVTSARHEKVATGLDKALAFLDPMVASAQAKRALVLETASKGWSAVYLNDTRSGGMRALSAYLTTRLKTESVYFMCQANTVQRKAGKVTGKFGAIKLVMYNRGNKKRIIEVINDVGRWKFGSSGKPLRFEDTQRYKLRDTQERFTPAMLIAYLTELKLRPFDDAFFKVDKQHPAAGLELVVHDPELRDRFQPLPLAKARKAFGPFNWVR
jgi:hypothetical protein